MIKHVWEGEKKNFKCYTSMCTHVHDSVPIRVSLLSSKTHNRDETPKDFYFKFDFFFFLPLLSCSYTFYSPSHFLLLSSCPHLSTSVTYCAPCASFCPLLLLIHNLRRIFLLFTSEGFNQPKLRNNILWTINHIFFIFCVSRQAPLKILNDL